MGCPGTTPEPAGRGKEGFEATGEPAGLAATGVPEAGCAVGAEAAGRAAVGCCIGVAPGACGTGARTDEGAAGRAATGWPAADAGGATPGVIFGGAVDLSGTVEGIALGVLVAGDAGLVPTGGAEAAGRAGFALGADFAASAAASCSASCWKCLRTSTACSMSSELECVFFSVTPIAGR